MRFAVTIQLWGAALLSPLAAAAQGPKQIGSQTGHTSLESVLSSIFDILIIFIPAVATVYLAISGYRYIISQGNPDLIEKAKKSLTYAVFGVILAFAAVLIIYTIGGALGYKPAILKI